MVNQDELAICRRRGHKINLICEEWRQCKACGMWVREVTKKEEQEAAPPYDERDKLVESLRELVHVKADEHRVNQEELAICRRRGHSTTPGTEGWTPCRACGMWLRETMTIEEREEKPTRD